MIDIKDISYPAIASSLPQNYTGGKIQIDQSILEDPEVNYAVYSLAKSVIPAQHHRCNYPHP